MAAPSLQAELMAAYHPDGFATRASRRACERGIGLDPQSLYPPDDPAGIARFLPRPPDGEAWPSADWLPASMSGSPAGPMVDWHCFTGVPTDTPFFEEAIRQARSRPFNRVFTWRMALAAMMKAAPACAAPAGFVFHLSRCGSTLVHRMLAASGLVRAISEAPVFDSALQACLDPNLSDALRFALLRTVAAGLANGAGGQSLLLKLDSWHILFWRLLRAAFPATPMIFLHRDPVEILVSQRAMRGVQAVPQPHIAALCGIADHAALDLDEYCARVLAAFCRQASNAVEEGAMIAIDYRDLPGAVFARVLPQFGLAPGATEMEAMRAAAGRDAKDPGRAHVPDAAAKQARADPALRALAEAIVGEDYRRLAARAGVEG